VTIHVHALSERKGTAMSLLSLPQFALANADFVTPRLVVGGDLDYWDHSHARAQLAELVDAGVTHIVDARFEASDEDLVAALAPHIRYLHHGMDDAGQRVPGRWFDVGVNFVLNAMEDQDAIVLAHCHMGINRGPSLGYAVLLATGWDPIEALDAIRDARPIAAIGYAEDALAWHHSRTGASREQRRTDLQRLARWRRFNNIDVDTIIRRIRQTEPG
jgi:dual specificity phosphatase 3